MASVLDYVKIKAYVDWKFSNTLDGNDAEYIGFQKMDDSLADGNAIDKAEHVWYDERTVNASATDSLDLAGSLTNAFGATITFTKLKLIMVENRSTTAGDILHITRPAANGVPWAGAAADYVNLGPGGTFLLYCPSVAGIATVTAATGDLIDIVEAGGANNVTYRITLVGTDT